jgi:hypothetical protein
MKALQGSNMETQIVFRSATPIAVAVLEAIFLGREFPDRKSALALAAILASALAYVATDAQFIVSGFSAYTWISIYFVLICISMTLGKHLMSSAKTSVWGSVLLTNGQSPKALLSLDKMTRALSAGGGGWGGALTGCWCGRLWAEGIYIRHREPYFFHPVQASRCPC